MEMDFAKKENVVMSNTFEGDVLLNDIIFSLYLLEDVKAGFKLGLSRSIKLSTRQQPVKYLTVCGRKDPPNISAALLSEK